MQFCKIYHEGACIEQPYLSPSCERSSMLTNRSPMNAQLEWFLGKPVVENPPEYRSNCK